MAEENSKKVEVSGVVGEVKAIYQERAFCFVKVYDMLGDSQFTDVFLHFACLSDEDEEKLKCGTKVTFDAYIQDEGWCADRGARVLNAQYGSGGF